MAPPKQRDTLFRHYPFVLSKAIYLGFQYLCPGNKSLFKGPFLRILYLSVFRLLTGVDICPESVDAIRFKLYPDDALVDDNSDEEKKEGDSRLQMGPHQDDRRRSRHHGRDDTNKSTGQMNTDERVKNNKGNNEQNEMTTSTNGMEPRGRKLSSSNRNLMTKSISTRQSKSLPLKQQQVNFDVNQISPLLQQCLGRECISIRPKQFIKRIEPVRKDSTQTCDDDDGTSIDIGHGYDMNRLHSTDTNSTDDNGNDAEYLMQRHTDLKREMKTALLQSEAEYHKAMSTLTKEKTNALKSKETKEEMISKIMTQMGRSRGQRQQQRPK